MSWLNARVPNGSRDCHDSIALQEFLEFLPNKFRSIVINHSGWARIMAQPYPVKHNRHMKACFVEDGGEFWPPSGFVNGSEGVYFFDGALSWDHCRLVAYILRTDQVYVDLFPRCKFAGCR